MVSVSHVPVPRVVGIDIGGANLKASISTGMARSRSFPLWRSPQLLASELVEFLREWGNANTLAITMTGELCDCFRTKREGVEFILNAVREAFPLPKIVVWSTVGRFCSIAEASADPWKVAAANWHAQATFAGRLAPVGTALLVDTGSTTTDVIPLCDGKPVPHGTTDPERLRKGELVYTGARRTPVCALVHEGVAAELFATVQDAYLVLALIPENPLCNDTADGRPATIAESHARLSRMLGGDPEITSPEATHRLALDVYERQRNWIASGIHQVLDRMAEIPRWVIVSGSGEWLAVDAWREVATQRFGKSDDPQLCRLSEWIGPDESSAACAYAVAVLAEESFAE